MERRATIGGGISLEHKRLEGKARDVRDEGD